MASTDRCCQQNASNEPRKTKRFGGLMSFMRYWSNVHFLSSNLLRVYDNVYQSRVDKATYVLLNCTEPKKKNTNLG